uniref:Reverse transcriptase domain-containing protein n=1 Tax=Tanacetum cinerariifolium TaxID=118510 RepID=A0A6L2K4Y6_TANCI|nr:reverse transcriptase domain-containing protein [Tanacetum cinerariifolium]
MSDLQQGADKSFVSISLASMLNIPPITLDITYDIEMADGNLVGTNTIIQGCTLILLNQPFKIDLMLIKLGSFDVVIGMDWLSKYHARIICDEKVVHIPINGETLIIRGDRRATPVARAPYRLAPSEMRELSNQLQELADKDLMNRVCKPYLDKLVIVFIDDILIYSCNKEEHKDHMRIILELLKKEKVQGIHVDPAKIEAVKNWASPTTPTEPKLRRSKKRTSKLRTYKEGIKHLEYVLMEPDISRIKVVYYSLCFDLVPLTCMIFEHFIEIIVHSTSLNHPCCGTLPSCEVMTFGPACSLHMNHNSIHQSRKSCVEGLFADIDKGFEEWEWSCELTSFFGQQLQPSGFLQVYGFAAVLANLKPERLKADRARIYEEASKVESCPSEIILDDLLALDSIVRFDLGDRRLEQTATFSISTNSK